MSLAFAFLAGKEYAGRDDDDGIGVDSKSNDDDQRKKKSSTRSNQSLPYAIAVPQRYQ